MCVWGGGFCMRTGKSYLFCGVRKRTGVKGWRGWGVDGERQGDKWARRDSEAVGSDGGVEAESDGDRE